MAIIVNKEEKRRHIALACRELLLEYGINSLTISHIAQTAGVGKGTIYEYFENKEDIVFEIITTFIADHEKKLLERMVGSDSARQKLFHFLNMPFEEGDAHKHLKVYKEFLAISLLSESKEMLAFSLQCRQRFMAILDTVLHEAKTLEQIILPGALCTNSFAVFATGLVVDSRLEGFNVQNEINLFLDSIMTMNEKQSIKKESR